MSFHLIIEYRNFPYTPDGFGNHHVLTYAEEGFSPLNFHAQQSKLEKFTLCAFADKVNDRDEIGTLLPLAPISAVPRRLIRDTKEPAELAQFIVSFLETNNRVLQVETIIFDFVTSSLPLHARQALEIALKQFDDSQSKLSVVICE